MGVSGHHEQSYSQVVLKIRSATGESRIGHCASRESRQVGGRCRCARNRKGCDIGYVPAICSCERAYSVDTCTVAALDAITAFAVPNPGSSSRESAGFFRSGCSSGRPAERITQPTSEWQGFISPTLSAVDAKQTKQCLHSCQRKSQPKNEISVNGTVGNAVQSWSLAASGCLPLGPTSTLSRSDPLAGRS